MNLALIALVLVLALLLVWWGVRNRASHHAEGSGSDGLDTVAAWPPQATRVLTTQERQAHDLLRNALPAHMILAQVPLQRFLKVPTRFVICDRHSQVIAVVELRNDDPISGRARRRQDRMLKVLAAAQIPVHQWQSSALPSVDAAREAIAPPAPVSELPGTTSGVLRSAPGRPAFNKPRLEAQAATEAAEETAVREPPPSTWFDDLDTGPAPLDPDLPKKAVEHKNRPAR